MKILKSISKVAVMVAAAFFMAAQFAPAYSQTMITHSLGETKVAADPKRVVILDMGSLETYYELGIPVIGGPDNPPAYLEKFKEKNPDFSGVGSVAKANIAAIAALKPDLIIIGGRLRSAYDSLSAIAPTVSFGTNTDDFWPSFEKNVKSIASLHGKEKLADQKLAALHKKVEKVKQKSEADPGKALFVLHVNSRFNPNGPKSRFGFGYDVLGLKSAYTPGPSTGGGRRGQAAAGQTEQPRRQGPTLAQINPDYLFVIDRATGIKGTMPSKEELLTEDVKATNAFKNNKVFILPGNIWYLSGGGLISVEKQIDDIGNQLYGFSF